ncbi:MAG: cellulase family glycosylhydrolase, partial [Proteobacteria bacterium]|nr:cellulase family glycosylhydrolase [Pseudomonadota bacterium]
MPLAGAAAAPAPPVAPSLRRGVNLTNWFRFPPSAEPAALAAYLPDGAMAALRKAGFDFVRIAVQPDVLAGDPRRAAVLVEAVARLHRHGLAAVVGPHPRGWKLEESAADRAALAAFWAGLAPLLRGLDPRLTVPEALNEPVFNADPAAWAALQARVLAAIRSALPSCRVLLTGADWGSIGGLLALSPPPGSGLLYSVHFYDPAELTSLAAYRPGLDRAALARLPFPVEPPGCAPAEATADAATRDLVRFVCAMRWDAARIDARFAAAAAWGARHGVPVLLGEFGASAALNAPARLGWLR